MQPISRRHMVAGLLAAGFLPSSLSAKSSEISLKRILLATADPFSREWAVDNLFPYARQNGQTAIIAYPEFKLGMSTFDIPRTFTPSKSFGLVIVDAGAAADQVLTSLQIYGHANTAVVVLSDTQQDPVADQCGRVTVNRERFALSAAYMNAAITHAFANRPSAQINFPRSPAQTPG